MPVIEADDSVPNCPYCGSGMYFHFEGNKQVWSCKTCSNTAGFGERGDKAIVTESIVTGINPSKSRKVTSSGPTAIGRSHEIPPKFRSTQSDETTGLQPKSEWIKDRMFELTQAMERYSAANIQIPREWIAELKQLITLL